MPNHIMLYFTYPNQVTEKINKECMDFFWERGKKLKPNAWKKVCTIKEHEGLGIRRFYHFNNVCLAKLGWKVLTNENNWWVQFVKRKYLGRDNILSCKVKQKHYLAWKGILKRRDVIYKGMRLIVGNGKNILFWTHH